MEIHPFGIEDYDILQVSYEGGPWLDFSTLRTEFDAYEAVQIVATDGERFKNPKRAHFRIIHFPGEIVVYPKPKSKTTDETR